MAWRRRRGPTSAWTLTLASTIPRRTCRVEHGWGADLAIRTCGPHVPLSGRLGPWTVTPAWSRPTCTCTSTCMHPMDTCGHPAQAHEVDWLFYMRDENGDVVGFRTAIWQADVAAWLFENGVVRENGNGLGSIFAQQLVEYAASARVHIPRLA